MAEAEQQMANALREIAATYEVDMNGEYTTTRPLGAHESMNKARAVLKSLGEPREFECDECGARTFYAPTQQSYVCGTCEGGCVVPVAEPEGER